MQEFFSSCNPLPPTRGWGEVDAGTNWLKVIANYKKISPIYYLLIHKLLLQNID